MQNKFPFKFVSDIVKIKVKPDHEHTSASLLSTWYSSFATHIDHKFLIEKQAIHLKQAKGLHFRQKNKKQ